jgi:hypothetical protein
MVWEIPTMTTTVDAKKRITLRQAKPGERFDVQVIEDGAFVLRRLEPVRPAGRLVNPVKGRDGLYRWPVKLDRKAIVSAIRADRDQR